MTITAKNATTVTINGLDYTLADLIVSIINGVRLRVVLVDDDVETEIIPETPFDQLTDGTSGDRYATQEEFLTAMATAFLIAAPATLTYPTAATAGVVKAMANLVALVDNSGGAAADGTIAAITLTEPANLAAQTVINGQIANAIKELSTRLNALTASAKTVKLMLPDA